MRYRPAVHLLACIMTAATAWAQPRLRSVQLVTVAETVFVAAPPGDTSRLFSVQRNGTIRVHSMPNLTVRPTPFLTVPGVNTSGERGMLGLAFHPQYAQSGWFYFYYSRTTTQNTADTIIARCRVSQTDPNLADPSTLQVVLNMPNAGGNHVSGWIGFGPDGLLYIPHGDNGSDSNSQNMTTLRGKILRIDVDGPDNIPGNADDDGFPTDNDKLYTIPSTNPYVTDPNVPDEIWVSGVRNPYRCSFDTETGDLWVCDVGGGFREEVNRLTTSSGGANLGWPCAEGNIVWQPQCFQSIVNYTPPMFDFRQNFNPPPTISIPGACATVGGYVYRGSAIPCLRGTFVFLDACTSVYSLWVRGVGQVSEFRLQGLSPGGRSMGVDAAGELYAISSPGAIYRILPDGVVPGTPDCDNNGYYNLCEIRLGLSLDTNNNNIPDGCEGLCTDIDFNNNRVYPEDQDVIDFFNVLAGAPCDFPACDTIDFNRNAVFPEDQDVIDFFTVLSGGACS